MTFKSFFRSLIFITCLPNALAANTTSSQSLIVNILPLAAIIVFFYFIIIRPQQQEQNELKNVQNTIKDKQEIITMSGMLGQIIKVKEDWVQLKTSNETFFWVKRSQIQKVLPNGTIKHLEK